MDRLHEVVADWHDRVNGGDRTRAAAVVGDRVVVLGPKGSGAITQEQFADWVRRSGITLIPRGWHPVDDSLVVVEQDATWPGSAEPQRVATVFRVANGKVTAVLRRPDLPSAMELATICRDMAATA
ncbi:nuclear transport factor 2 family protein [Prauserella rugosa]|uniref:SnoaL-like protein n=1 Tax=Prauserella rugosa TaxID=43354 RepID=A0A660CC30_9PSEU|nr:nuclear transport factor 2 family protein [Prauserella rugosa]KMS88601.1 hypothetical protein ACZ91_24930 [Streptomyces regensis]TWH21140.1 hypothetical protein JD82_02994 [Prauserella rugosa]